jgi:UDP-2,3-diacylglucosamine hydrolase
MLALMASTGAPAFVHGHTHRPADELLAPAGSLSFADGGMASPAPERHVLSDWDLDEQHPGSSPRAEVLRFTAGGFERIGPETAAVRSR